MAQTLEIDRDAILLDRHANDVAGVIDIAAPALANWSGLEPAAIRAALGVSVASSDFVLGNGIAVPHVAITGLPQRVVCLVRTASPVVVRALDGMPADLFFVVLYPVGDPAGHLQFLAHLAGLCRSRVFRDGLRAAAAPNDVIDLIAAAEGRLGTAPPTVTEAASQRVLAIISVSGERAVDSILVGLVRERLVSATVFAAQTVQEAASREVPLFAEFRDLFGDPGGRRVIIAPVDPEQADAVAAIVQQACEDEPAASAELTVVPIANRWQWGPPAVAPEQAGE